MRFFSKALNINRVAATVNRDYKSAENNLVEMNRIREEAIALLETDVDQRHRALA
jgi:hypothetical protein